MEDNVIWSDRIEGLPIVLIQHGPDRFTVRYWKQRKEGLSYNETAKELGKCILHALACAGELDERSSYDKTRLA